MPFLGNLFLFIFCKFLAIFSHCYPIGICVFLDWWTHFELYVMLVYKQWMSTLHDFINCRASIETLHWRKMQCFNGGMTIGDIMKCPLDLPSFWPHPQLVVNHFTCKFAFIYKPSQVNLCTFVHAPMWIFAYLFMDLPMLTLLHKKLTPSLVLL